MGNMEKIVSIWDATTGIQELGASAESLRQPQIKSLADVWHAIRLDLEGTIKLRDFQERMNREWAIETGILENLYDIPRGLTVSFIEHGFRADLISHGDLKKPQTYVLQLLNAQKEAIDGVFDFVAARRQLSVSFIRELHGVLMAPQDTTEGIDSLGRSVDVAVIKGDWKKTANFPTRNGVRFDYCPPEQVASEMDRLISIYTKMTEEIVSPEVAAAWLHHRFTQVHPFQDGNGRVARALASLVLIQAGLFPFVLKRDQKAEYIDALEEADNGELGALVSLISKMQLAAFQSATAISAEVKSEHATVDAALAALTKSATRTRKKMQQQMDAVFKLAEILNDVIFERLEALSPQLEIVLRKVDPASRVQADHSTPDTGHYFRNQIVQNAKDFLNYFVDTSEYRSWVALKISWNKQAKAVFAFHGFGRPFKGNLLCAPFLEIKNVKDEESDDRGILVPLANEPFQFFFSDDLSETRTRFIDWSDKAIAVLIEELRRSI
jgi:Fic family protein